MLQLAFDTSSDAMLILDAELRTRWANQRAADLWAQGMAILLPGKSLGDLLVFHRGKGEPIAANDPDHPLVQMAQQGDGAGRFLLSQPGASMPLTPWMVSWRKVLQQGPGAALLLSFRELGPAELALEKQQLFLNQLAHELRTPLAIVMGNLQRLDRLPGLQPASRSQLQVASEESLRISRLLEHLTVLSQLDMGCYAWSFERVSIKTAIESWLAQLDRQARERIQVEFEGRVQDQVVRLDVQAFRRVLNLLLENSLLYSPEATPIVLRSQLAGDALELLLMDWGTGIPADCLDQVFERFIRLEHHRHASRSDGAGLGLAVVKGLVEGMSGGVAVVPNPVEQVLEEAGRGRTAGTVVQLRFPLL